jgi:hypothetical protein
MEEAVDAGFFFGQVTLFCAIRSSRPFSATRRRSTRRRSRDRTFSPYRSSSVRRLSRIFRHPSSRIFGPSEPS